MHFVQPQQIDGGAVVSSRMGPPTCHMAAIRPVNVSRLVFVVLAPAKTFVAYFICSSLSSIFPKSIAICREGKKQPSSQICYAHLPYLHLCAHLYSYILAIVVLCAFNLQIGDVVVPFGMLIAPPWVNFVYECSSFLFSHLIYKKLNAV